MTSQLMARLVWILGAVLLTLCALYALASAQGAHFGPEGTESAYHVAGVMFAGAVYLLAVRWGRRASVGVVSVFVLGLGMRLLLVAAPLAPNPQDDYYRYLWDGAVTARGLNPYRYSPQEALTAARTGSAAEPGLAEAAASARTVLPGVNHPHLTTIYPPVAQGGFALANLVWPHSVIGLRAVFLGFDLAAFVILLALLRRLRMHPASALVYWWNPIVLNWIYGEVHMDVLLFPFLLLAVLAAFALRPWLTAASLALAAGVKLWPIVLLPALMWRWRGDWRRMLGMAAASGMLTVLLLSPMLLTDSDSPAGLWAYAGSWQNNALLYPMLEGVLSSWIAYVDARLAARLVTGVFLLAWVLLVVRSQGRKPQGLTRTCLLIAAGVFLLSPTQFPWYYTWLLPLLVFWPVPALLSYTLFLPLYNLAQAYPWVVWLEHIPFWLILLWEISRRWRQASNPRVAPPQSRWTYVDRVTARVAVVIPALNEERSIGRVLAAIPNWVKQVVVADNCSTDRTAEVARAAGAQVVAEPRRGYGAACLAGMSALDRPDIVVFLDADFSDDPREMERIVTPILEGEADLVIGSRTLGAQDPGALTVPQRFGNALACRLIRWLWGHTYTDLGPFRAIRFDALRALAMDDRGYGWTIQMQLRALRVGLAVQEVPVSYRRRIGQSKVSGTVRGVIGAGSKILSLIPAERFWRPEGKVARDRLVVFARYPVAGTAKTRLIPHLGREGAAALQDAMTRHTLTRAADRERVRGVEVEICFTGADIRQMAGAYGQKWIYTPQGEGDLGERLQRAILRAFATGVGKIVVIGTDCPGITSAGLQQAFDALDANDLAVGPAADGGFYLLGLRQPCPELFQDMAWGTSEVRRQLLAAARRLNLSVARLATLHDVDRPEDLPAWESAAKEKTTSTTKGRLVPRPWGRQL